MIKLNNMFVSIIFIRFLFYQMLSHPRLLLVGRELSALIIVVTPIRLLLIGRELSTLMIVVTSTRVLLVVREVSTLIIVVTPIRLL